MKHRTKRPYWKRLAIGALAASAAVFALVAANIAAGDPLAALDARVAAWAQANRDPALTLLLTAVTHAHAPAAVCGYAAGMAAFLARRRERYWLLGLALAVPGGLTVNVALKHLFHRARPVLDDPLMLLSSYSFPSGHTAGATLFYGVLVAWLISRAQRVGPRVTYVAGWIAIVSLVALSRVYLGVHYLTDLVAAVAWSLAWLALCLLAVHRLHVSRATAVGAEL